MLKQVIVCDFCHKNVEQQNMRQTNYISITGNSLDAIGPNVYLMGEIALVPNLDFCSKACLAGWSTSNA